MKRRSPYLLLAGAVLLALCVLLAAAGLLAGQGLTPARAVETPVQVIRLTNPVARSTTEASGLAWHGDWLIILPQYPHRFRRDVGNPDGALWGIPKADLLAYLDTPPDENPARLEPVPIPLEDNGVRRMVAHFQGFEAIAFDGDTAYLSIEAEPDGGMQGWLVRGTMLPGRAGLVLDPDSLQPVNPQAGIANLSEEALLFYNGELLSFYEANGARANPGAVAHRFSADLQPLGQLTTAALEYRLTDASEADEEGRFWVMNFFYPGDLQLIAFGEPLAAQYGRGPTHRFLPLVERIVELQVTENGVERVERAPVQLRLEQLTGRNWEGLARLDERGLLLITDLHPDTVLAFVPLDSP